MTMAKKTTKKAAKATKVKAAPKAKATKKAAPKAKATKKAAKPAKAKRKPNPALLMKLTPSEALAAVVGGAPLPRSQALKKVWDYIKKYNLQDATNRRKINADDKLKTLFGKASVGMLEIGGILAKHLK
jgi:upstream activation factor subunit UAF30